MALLVEVSDEVTLITEPWVRFPSVTIRQSPRQAFQPALPLCVIDKCDRVEVMHNDDNNNNNNNNNNNKIIIIIILLLLLLLLL